MRHMLAVQNLGLCMSRNVETGTFSHVACAHTIIGHHCVSLKEVNYLFPLRLTSDEDELLTESRVNFSTNILHHFKDKNITPEDIFHYIYAIFHSPGYRTRYAEFLKIDFPRLPLTGNINLFRSLSRLGAELVSLHLLESPKLDAPITKYIGARAPEVEKVSWTENTVWLDKAKTTGFAGVREEVWNFHIGGYQVCEKWLKDRKGRVLTADDIAHYQKIIIALSETHRLMPQIDHLINSHGGWPGAFQAVKTMQEEML